MLHGAVPRAQRLAAADHRAPAAGRHRATRPTATPTTSPPTLSRPAAGCACPRRPSAWRPSPHAGSRSPCASRRHPRRLALRRHRRRRRGGDAAAAREGRQRRMPSGTCFSISRINRQALPITIRLPGPAHAQADAALRQARGRARRRRPRARPAARRHDADAGRDGQAARLARQAHDPAQRLHARPALPRRRARLPHRLDRPPTEGAYLVRGVIRPKGSAPVYIDRSSRSPPQGQGAQARDAARRAGRTGQGRRAADVGLARTGRRRRPAAHAPVRHLGSLRAAGPRPRWSDRRGRHDVPASRAGRIARRGLVGSAGIPHRRGQRGGSLARRPRRGHQLRRPGRDDRDERRHVHDRRRPRGKPRNGDHGLRPGHGDQRQPPSGGRERRGGARRGRDRVCGSRGAHPGDGDGRAARRRHAHRGRVLGAGAEPGRDAHARRPGRPQRGLHLADRVRR